LGSEHDTAGVVFILEDLTEVQSSQRSLAWKEVARRLAHEFKNPLTPIRLSAERLQRLQDHVSPEKVQSATKAIMISVDQLTQLVDEFSQYAKLPEVQLERADMNEILVSTIEIYRESHPEIEFKLLLDVSIPPFLFDPKQMGRAFSNVIKNSMEALAETVGGVIEVQTLFASRLGVVTVVVSDNGVGIPDEVVKRLFEPYFSTRQKGTGLGLAIVQRIVQDHQGSIRVQRNAPKGTRFVFDLPVRGAAQLRTVPQVTVT
jgi:two-component system nitrogen regulation sensor histidine kinase NtrY